jgi:hypothetical protein
MDSYTVAFGIRNVTNRHAALCEAHRVLRRGGRLLCLEFSQVSLPLLRQLYDAYSFNVIPKIGGLVAHDEASYQYLVESIRQFPDQVGHGRCSYGGAGPNSTVSSAFAALSCNVRLLQPFIVLRSGWHSYSLYAQFGSSASGR